MAITPQCDKCKKELKTFGGILLSPPDERERVRKFHLCVECYEIYAQGLEEKKKEPDKYPQDNFCDIKKDGIL